MHLLNSCTENKMTYKTPLSDKGQRLTFGKSCVKTKLTANFVCCSYMF